MKNKVVEEVEEEEEEVEEKLEVLEEDFKINNNLMMMKLNAKFYKVKYNHNKDKPDMDTVICKYPLLYQVGLIQV